MNNATVTGSHHYAGEFSQYLSMDKKFGYINSVKTIPNSRPISYGVKIGVPVGKGSNIKYIDFDLIVASADAFSLFNQYRDQINNEDSKVTARFSAGSLLPSGYIAKSGSREGEVISCLRGKLTYITNLKINGDLVYSHSTLPDQPENKEDADDNPRDKSQASDMTKKTSKRVAKAS